jgi:hypothetical protein
MVYHDGIALIIAQHVTTIEELPVPDFEIDHPKKYAQYFLSNPREISFYLNLLVKRGCLVTAHINDGRLFFSRQSLRSTRKKTKF